MCAGAPVCGAVLPNRPPAAKGTAAIALPPDAPVPSPAADAWAAAPLKPNAACAGASACAAGTDEAAALPPNAKAGAAAAAGGCPNMNAGAAAEATPLPGATMSPGTCNAPCQAQLSKSTCQDKVQCHPPEQEPLGEYFSITIQQTGERMLAWRAAAWLLLLGSAAGSLPRGRPA